MKNYQDMVYSVAVRMLASETDAEDISQVVFLKAFENFPMLSSNPSAGGWLKTVTTNLCLNHLTRYRARWRFFSEMLSRDDDDDATLEIAAPDNLGDKLDEADYRRLLEQALQKLPTTQRVPLVLFHFESLSYEEIAAKLSISLSKVKTDIFRGREALRKKLSLPAGDTDEWSDFKPQVKDRAPTHRTSDQDRSPTGQCLLALGLAHS